jgi:hypothetical protein
MFQETLSNLPWLHVLVAAIAYFALGAIWYGPLFSKAWVRGHAINMSDPDAKKGVAGIMITSFFIVLAICIALAILLEVTYVKDIAHAVKWGLFIGIGFVVTTTSMTYIYLKKPVSIHLIDGLYHVIGIVIASVILTAWQ